MPTIIIKPNLQSLAAAAMVQQPGMKVLAKLTSLDNGLFIFFDWPPSEHEREYGALWDQVSVCEADPTPSEYRHTNPERRVYKITLSTYEDGGLGSSIEGQLQTLKAFTERAPGKVRAHRCVYSQGEQVFRPCFVESVHVSVRRLNRRGGAMQTEERAVLLALKKLPG